MSKQWKSLGCMAFQEIHLDKSRISRITGDVELSLQYQTHVADLHIVTGRTYIGIANVQKIKNCKTPTETSTVYLRGGEEEQETNNPNDILYTFCIAVQESIMAGNRWSPKPCVAFYRKDQGMLIVIGKELIQFNPQYKVLWKREVKTHYQGIQEAMLMIGALELPMQNFADVDEDDEDDEYDNNVDRHPEYDERTIDNEDEGDTE